MDTICFSVGGSIISKESGVNVAFIKGLSALLQKYGGKRKFIIVVGGGHVNGNYLKDIKPEIQNNSTLDMISIAFTRINAAAVLGMLSGMDAYPKVAESLDELGEAFTRHNVVVMGGLLPGITTDAVSVLACERVEGKELVNVSSEAYVYDRSPREDGAQRLESLTYDQLISLACKYDTREARAHFLFDLVACKLIKRAGITVRFVGEDLSQLELAIEGKQHKGSTVGQ